MQGQDAVLQPEDADPLQGIGNEMLANKIHDPGSRAPNQWW